MGVSESISIIRGDISSGGGTRRWDERDGVLVSRDGVTVTLLVSLLAAAVVEGSSQEVEEEERR